MPEKSALPSAVVHSEEELAKERTLTREMETRDEKLPVRSQDDDGKFHLKINDVRAYSEMFGGTKSFEFAEAMSLGCIKHCTQSANAFAIVAEIAPKDGIEAMLATQMASVHLAAMAMSRKMAEADYLDQLEAYERSFNKLTRTFTTQMEALRKHRHGGKQTVTVQHVNVEDGGQAIVGNVENRGRVARGK